MARARSPGRRRANDGSAGIRQHPFFLRAFAFQLSFPSSRQSWPAGLTGLRQISCMKGGSTGSKRRRASSELQAPTVGRPWPEVGAEQTSMRQILGDRSQPKRPSEGHPDPALVE
jgi:hypothetical protein